MTELSETTPSPQNPSALATSGMLSRSLQEAGTQGSFLEIENHSLN